ncbi:hypothetical protein [Demequina sp. NBRC 110056]|uniref:hypothetical protein n=1 Tax=Demequina sp. NBRC 110056 TaxID=1570345 RepID=UPI000A0502F9|nr:hypothetical protein [Demequina sp. NBRC 110056]
MFTTATAAAALSVVALAGCGAPGLPDRDPEAVGAAAVVMQEDPVTAVVFLPDAGYEYFDQTAFTLDDSTPLEGVADRRDIAEGDRLEVWTGPCAESFPVQCDVVGVRVLD